MPSCPIIQRVNVGSSLEINDPYSDQNWNEISGMAISTTQVGPSGQPVLFGHNDGPNSKMAFAAWDSGTGRRLKTINLQSNSGLPLFHQDWEDMAMGTCGGAHANDSCIYLADTGDNRAQDNGSDSQRNGRPYTIYKIREPRLNEIPDNAVLRAEDYISVLQFDYGHSSSPTRYANCEAMFIDHTGWGGEVGDLYLVTKWAQDKSARLNRLFKIPPSAWANGFGKVQYYRPFVVGEYSNNSGGSFYRYEWTGADMSRDGTTIALTWKDETHLFERCLGESVEGAIAGRSRSSCVQYRNPPEGANPGNQYEAVAFTPNGNRLYNLAESLDPPRIIQVDLVYTSDSRSGGGRCLAIPLPPTPRPSPPPTRPPTRNPTPPPTREPTPRPTPRPSPIPTLAPSDSPSGRPSASPSDAPSVSPSVFPSDMPSTVPSDLPSVTLSSIPSTSPTIYLDNETFRLGKGGTAPQQQDGVVAPDIQLIFLCALFLVLITSTIVIAYRRRRKRREMMYVPGNAMSYVSCNDPEL